MEVKRSTPFSIAGISMIKNEADILETFVRHNLNFVDCLIIIDNNSADASSDILCSLIQEGLPICVIDDRVMGHFQSERITNLLARINSAFFSDFVIPLDADEFIQAESRSNFLAEILEIPDPGVGYIRWITYIPGSESGKKELLPHDFQYRRKIEQPQYYKVIIRTGGRPLMDIVVAQGSHDVICQSTNIPKVELENVKLAHFPIRGKWQIAGKVLLGWLANLARDRNSAKYPIAYQWQQLYNKITTEGDEISDLELTEMAINYAQEPKLGATWQDHVEPACPCILADKRQYDSDTGKNLVSLIVSSWARQIAPEPESITKDDLRRFSSSGVTTAKKHAGVFENDWHINNLFIDIQPFKYLSVRLNPSSVLDVGCGIGQYLKLFKRFGASEVFGIDGFTPEYSFLQDDDYVEHDLAQPLNLGRHFDLVICLEVAEHFPPGTEAHLLDDLELHAKDFLLFSAAEIGQGGYGHVNCRPFEFWADMLNARGWAPLLFETLAFRSISTQPWLRRNPVLLTRQSMDKHLISEAWEKLIAISRMRYQWYGYRPCIISEPLRYMPPDAYHAVVGGNGGSDGRENICGGGVTKPSESPDSEIGMSGMHIYARSEIVLGTNDALAKLAARVPETTQVLDVGCSIGVLGKYLSEQKGCAVDGVDLNPDAVVAARLYYRRILLVDLEDVAALASAIGDARYDRIICGDVLEHIRDPGGVLCVLQKFLRLDGKILVSVPNVGHAGVLLELLSGDFKYREEGLLDRTHLRFFTRNSFLGLLADFGLVGHVVDRTVVPVEQSEFRDVCHRAPHWIFRIGLMESLLRERQDSDTYQFILEITAAVPKGAERHCYDGIMNTCVPGLSGMDRERGEANPGVSLPTAGRVGPYAQWCNIFGLHESDGQVMAERMVLRWNHQPTIHLIVVLRCGKGVRLAATLDSLSTQLYAGWGLTVLAEEPCPDPLFTQIPNVEWRELKGDRAAALNAIVGEAESDWVGLLCPGDRLAQQALFACVDRIQVPEPARLLYTDWDRIDDAGNRSDPRFERDADLDWLRTGDCLGGFWLVRRDALIELGGFGDHGPAEARDVALRVFERFGAGAFGHVDEVLCHRPAFSRVAEEGVDTGSHYAVLSAHLRRMGESGEILDGLAPGTLRVRYPVQGEPVVSVIVDTVDDLRVLERFIDTLREATEYRNLELVVVDCGSQDEDTEEYFDALRASGVIVVSAPEGSGRAEAWNAGACAAHGEYLIFADRRAGFVQKDWLETLLGHAQRKGVGIVAPRIVGADGTVVHSALILGFGGPAKDAFRELSALDPGYGGRAFTEQGCSAVPPACLLVSRACFEEVGGFDAERFSSDWFSVDFCLRSEAAGHHTIWTPYALVGWQAHEPARETGDPEQEAAVYERWLPRLARDPFYHRNLDLSGAVFQPRMEATARWNPVFHERPWILGVPADTFGCGEYRILAPLNALDDAARAHCGLLAPQEGSPRMPSVTELARLAPDTLLLQGALDDVHLEALRRYRRFNQVFRVFDMEDLKTNVPEKNSRRPFLFRNIKARTRQALSLCDRLIVTTEPLAEVYRGLIGDIKVVPVYLARERWGTVAAARNESGRPRVGWAGGQQHEGDLEILLPIVQATAGEVDWVFLGMCPEVLRPYVKEVHDMVSFAEYPARLASLALDLAVAPLEEHPFNVAKTNLRLLEYGILRWPVVCTDIEPYRGVPVMRVPNDPVRWIEAIRERVNDLDAARAEGARLREWVLGGWMLGGWMLEDHLDEWLEALSPSEGTGAVVAGQPQRIADGRGN